MDLILPSERNAGDHYAAFKGYSSERRSGHCGVIGVEKGIRAALPEGNPYLVPSDATTVFAARVEVRKLDDLEASLKANGAHDFFAS